MADNVTLNAGSGGDTIAADDVSGVKYQVVKLAVGADGAASLVANANPIPVSDAGTTLSVDDGAGSLTVDGTVAISGTVAVTDNSGSLTIDNAALAVTGGGVEASALRVTIASDSTGVLSVDDNGGSLTVDGAVAATQSGTWNVGTVTTVTTVSTVSAVSAVTPGTGATNLGKAEDAAHTSGDVGVMALAVRNDAGGALAGTTGDYIPLTTDSSGALRVVGSSGTTQYAEDAASAGGESLCLGGAVRQDTLSSSTSADGDYSALKASSTGALYVNVAEGGIAGIAEDSASAGGENGVMVLAVRRDSASSGVSADGDFAALSVDSNGALRVSGASGTTQYTEDAASAGAESLCLMGAVRRDTAASSSGTDGDYSTINTDASGRLWVNASGAAVPVTDNSGSLTVDNAGTFAVQPAGAAAQDAAISGNPLPIGMRASTATPTAMSADGDVVYPWATRNGATVIDGSIVDDAAFTPATSRVVPIGCQADESSTDSVDEGDAGCPRMTLDRKQIVTVQPHTQGGLSVATGSIGNTVTSIKASAGQVYGWYFYNANASVAYVQFFNTASGSVTLGTTSPVYSLGIPASSGANVMMPCGIEHTTAIVIAVTTTRAGSTNTGSTVDYNVFYK